MSSGQPTSQGQRNDLKKVVRDIGRPDLDWNGVVLENQSAYIKYHRGMRALFKVVRPQQLAILKHKKYMRGARNKGYSLR